MMDELKLVTYCGLYCGLCSQINRTPILAGKLTAVMKKDGWDYWGHEIPKFTEFWEFLQQLAKKDENCNCRNGNCGAPFCTIRKCAREKGIDLCVDCKEYPCRRIEGIAKGYPTLIADGKRIKEIGMEKWVKEQEERRASGFAYVDIRCYPYEVPMD